MFSSVLNFFKKPQGEKIIKEEGKPSEESMDDFVKTSTSDETLAKFVIKPEESAYFIGINDMNARKILIESEKENQDLINLGVDKRLSLFVERLKEWK